MELHFSSKLDEYYQKFVELQEKLRKSEEQRFQLEMKFNEMVQTGRQEQQEHYRRLRAQYKRFLEEDKKRQERNDRILRNLERVETRISMLSAKTERIDVLRRQYRSFLCRITNPQPAASNKRPINESKPSLFKDDGLPTLKLDKASCGTQTNQEQMKILDKYLESVSSEKCKGLLGRKSDKIPDLFYGPNKASAIADDIMNSIYSRHYNKEIPKLRAKICVSSDIEFDSKPQESVYTLANNQIEEHFKKIDEEPAFHSALDVALARNTEQLQTSRLEVSEQDLGSYDKKPECSPKTEVDTIYYNKDYQPSDTQFDLTERKECDENISRAAELPKYSESQRLYSQEIKTSLKPESEQENQSNLTCAEQQSLICDGTNNSVVQPGALENLNDQGIKAEEISESQPITDTEPYQENHPEYNQEDLVSTQQQPDCDQNGQPLISDSPEKQPGFLENLDGQETRVEGMSKSQPITDTETNQENDPGYYQSDLLSSGCDQYGQSWEYDNARSPGVLDSMDNQGINVEETLRLQPLTESEPNQEDHPEYYQSDLVSLGCDQYGQPSEYDNAGNPGALDSLDNQVIKVEETSILQPVTESEPNQEDHPEYYQSDLTYAEQYDQQQSGYDQYGQPLVYDQQGQAVQPHFDENGQMLPQYDENGQLIMLYDHQGRSYFEETQPAYGNYGYDGQGEYLEDGRDKQSYLEETEQAQESQDFKEDRQPGLEDTEQSHQQQDDDIINIRQEEVLEKQEDEEVEYPEKEVEKNKATNEVVEEHLGNVMDMLDTDTEVSSKQNTSKVSNDTDFDFS